MCSSFNDAIASIRRASIREKNRNREYLFGPISVNDVEWAKSALDANAQVKRHTVKDRDIDRISTADSETIGTCNNLPDVCVQTNGAHIKDLINNIQDLSLKLGAETRQRESLEQQLAQLREQNGQLMAELQKACATGKEAAAYTAAVETINNLDVKEFGHNCEEIMDTIYTTICDAFGPDNNLALLFEEMADIYLKSESNHVMEVQCLQKQIEFLSQFENVFKGEVQPTAKSLGTLVEQLKSTKEEAAQEIDALRKKLDRMQGDYAKMEERSKIMEEAFEAEREELNVKIRVHQGKYQQLMRAQAQLLSQLPLLKLTATEEHAEADVLRQTGSSTLEALVSALYRKDAEMQKLIRHKDDILQQQQSTINKLESCVKEWEADAILWLDYVNQNSSKKRIGALKVN